MNKKKKGVTLLEVGVSLFIITLTLSIGSVSYRYYKDYETLVIEKEFLNHIYSFINYSRKTCISEEKPGEIINDKEIKSITFRMIDKNGKEIVQSLEIPDNIIFLKEASLKINSKGELNSTSIEWKGIETNSIYKITISVGINTMRVYINGKQEEW